MVTKTRRGIVRTVVATGAVAAALGFTSPAHAGYAFAPASGSTTTSQPTFDVVLGADEVPGAEVYVASDAQMGSYYIPTNEVASCSPSNPAGTADHFTCQPSYYLNGGLDGRLPPGTYYWWLTFWHRDATTNLSTLEISGPLTFTVPAPVPPTGVSLLSPADGAAVSPPVSFRIAAPAQARMHIYVSMDATRQDDGSPRALADYACSVQTTEAGTYYCTDQTSNVDFVPGIAYYWWAVITVGANSFVYGPRSFTIQSPSSGGGGGGGGGSGGGSTAPTVHTLFDASKLPHAVRYTGKSIKETRLSAAAYKLSETLHAPKSVAVICWSGTDWPGVSGDSLLIDGGYTKVAFWTPSFPHLISLSPLICRGVETLIHHRPQYPNRFTANAVETVAHELMHAIGINHGSEVEARAECYGMQLSLLLATDLGVPFSYAEKLAKLNLQNYLLRPPAYQDPVNCREGGAWDIWPNAPSPPWHIFER